MDEYGTTAIGRMFRGPAGDLRSLNKAIENIIERGASSPAAKGRLARLMALRDQSIAKQAAQQGAAMAVGSGFPGAAGGLASSGIRGMDVIEQDFTPEVVRQYNAEGAAQGLRGSSQVPPGSGRLNSIPFLFATNSLGATNPVQEITSTVLGVSATRAMSTAAVNWAILKIVAFTTQSQTASSGTFGVVEDLKIGGSANLLLTEGNVLMDEYDVDRDSFTGLRAYPYLISPNTATVTAGINASTAVGAGAILFAICSLVVDVIRDDAFGPGLPGAYAR